jgi:hypothetical protein
MVTFRAMTERNGQATTTPVTLPVPKIGAELAALTDKVTDAMTFRRADWMRAATEYARTYTGTNDFMVDMRGRVAGGLTIPQMRGILNCMRAEAIRIVNSRTVATPAKPVQNRQPAAVAGLNEVLDGFYTVKFEDGSHVTIRINRISPKQSRDGKAHRYASYLCGPINTLDYRRFAAVNTNTFRVFSNGVFNKQVAALEVLMGATVEGQTAFGKAYAKAATRCYRCGKLLTEPESIESGIGPICAGRE